MGDLRVAQLFWNFVEIRHLAVLQHFHLLAAAADHMMMVMVRAGGVQFVTAHAVSEIAAPNQGGLFQAAQATINGGQITEIAGDEFVDLLGIEGTVVLHQRVQNRLTLLGHAQLGFLHSINQRTEVVAIVVMVVWVCLGLHTQWNYRGAIMANFAGILNRKPNTGRENPFRLPGREPADIRGDSRRTWTPVFKDADI